MKKLFNAKGQIDPNILKQVQETEAQDKVVRALQGIEKRDPELLRVQKAMMEGKPPLPMVLNKMLSLIEEELNGPPKKGKVPEHTVILIAIKDGGANISANCPDTVTKFALRQLITMWEVQDAEKKN